MMEILIAGFGASAALACAALVLARAPLSAASAGLVWGLALFGASELGHVALFAADPTRQAAWLRLIRGVEAVALPGWAVFSVAFARRDLGGELRSWRGMLAGIGVLSAAVVAMAAWLPDTGFYGPLAGDAVPLRGYGRILDLLVLPGIAFVLLQTASTLRSSRGVVRWQIKYFLLGVLGLFAFRLFVLGQTLLADSVGLTYQRAQSVVMLLSLGLIGFGVVRHRLLRVAVFVSRHLVYRSLTVAVTGGYVLTVGLAAAALRKHEVPIDLFVASLAVFVTAMTLLVVLLSERLRWRVKRMITSNFYENKYDYRREWTELTAKLTSVASLDAIMPRLVATVVESMGLRKAALYIADNRGFRLTETAGEDLVDPSRLDLPADLLARVAAEPRAVTLDPAGPAAAGTGVEELCTEGFSRLVPLVVNEDVLGFLAVSPSKDSPLSEEDEEFLCTVAAQAGTALLNARLGERLAQAREMEAFHRVSSFLLHDLKNCVSTLSLVVQNGESFAAEPAFRRDAFRSIRQSVLAIEQLIARLSHLPKGLELRLEPVALNALAMEVVTRARLAAGERIRFVCALDDVPLVLADEDQCRKVLDNLVLNAIEAVIGDGQVEIRTFARGSKVLVEIADSGPGIPEAILQDGLFTPFRTTKPRGLGIGLYQVKTIVDAHGGHIDLQSEEGRGARVTVELPATQGDVA